MLSRFGIVEHLKYYNDQELSEGLKRDATRMGSSFLTKQPSS